jgi:hypothetical protein
MFLAPTRRRRSPPSLRGGSVAELSVSSGALAFPIKDGLLLLPWDGIGQAFLWGRHARQIFHIRLLSLGSGQPFALDQGQWPCSREHGIIALTNLDARDHAVTWKSNKRPKQDVSRPDPTWANWPMPMFLSIGPYRKEVVANPAEALSFLANRWVGQRDETYHAARAACSKSLRRRLNPQDARDLFFRFARAAGLIDCPP